MRNRDNTPGPFRKANDFGGEKIYQDDRGELSHRSLLRFSSTAGYEEREKLVDLLNKGTHFDEMLAALKEAYGLPDYVGIDETEVGEKELVVSCEIWRERWGEMIAKLTGQSTD